MKKNNLPLEEQTITLEQARQIAEIFRKAGVEMPKSLWVWIYGATQYNGEAQWVPRLENSLQKMWHTKGAYPAYTGDEIGVLLLKSAGWEKFPGHHSTHEKAEIAIRGFKEGWINPKDFNYG